MTRSGQVLISEESIHLQVADVISKLCYFAFKIKKSAIPRCREDCSLPRLDESEMPHGTNQSGLRKILPGRRKGGYSGFI